MKKDGLSLREFERKYELFQGGWFLKPCFRKVKPTCLEREVIFNNFYFEEEGCTCKQTACNAEEKQNENKVEIDEEPKSSWFTLW